MNARTGSQRGACVLDGLGFGYQPRAPFACDPKDTRGIPLYVYDSSTQAVSTEPLEEFLDLLPTRLIQFRIYALNHATEAIAPEHE